MHAILSSPPGKLLLQNISFAFLSSNKKEKKRGQFQTSLNTTGNLLIHNRELGFKVLVAWSSLTLCDPMDCNPPGSSVHGILQARILEWAIPFPGDLPNPRVKSRSFVLQADSLLSEPPEKL